MSVIQNGYTSHISVQFLLSQTIYFEKSRFILPIAQIPLTFLCFRYANDVEKIVCRQVWQPFQFVGSRSCKTPLIVSGICHNDGIAESFRYFRNV